MDVSSGNGVAVDVTVGSFVPVGVGGTVGEALQEASRETVSRCKRAVRIAMGLDVWLTYFV